MKRSIFLFLTCFLLIAALNSSGDEGSSEKQVIIITIDGLRADIINPAYTPKLYRLLKTGSYSLNANTVIPSITTAAHTSLITGLTPDRHSINTNDWKKDIKNFNSETIYTAASENGQLTGLIVGKYKLILLKTGSEDTFFRNIENREDSIKLIRKTALDFIFLAKPNLVLIHFPEPDFTGHEHHWVSEEYLEKVKEVDKSVYSMIKVILKKNTFKDYLIIITSDHGGMGSNHRIKHEKIQKIPLIVLGERIKKNNMLDDQIYIYDISPTVLDFLGLDIPSGLDGNIINDIYID